MKLSAVSRWSPAGIDSLLAFRSSTSSAGAVSAPFSRARAWIALLDPLDISLGGYPDGRYVSVGGKDAVYLVDDALASLDGDASDWADMQIPSPSGSTIQAIEISNAGADLALVKTNGAWTATDLGAVDPDLVATNLRGGIILFGGISQLLVTPITDLWTIAAASVAVVLGTINLAGGFFVTHRMLSMFVVKRKPAKAAKN